MALGWRFLILEEDDGIRRVPQRHVDRLVAGKSPLPEYAGRVIRTAFVMLELHNRQPAQITHLEGAKRHFDDRGYIKQRVIDNAYLWSEDSEEGTRSPGDNVINITDRLCKKRQDDMYRWDPTPAEITRMIDFIWPRANR